MPFPLAHPAAVLPLRRFCPRRLNFPALIIGSLCPDIGYCFGRFHVDKFSHRFIAGGFGFCLPVGLWLMLMFYLVRRPMVQWLPARHRRIFEPLCLRPAGSFMLIVISLLVGAWTHIFLDSITHEHGLFVEHLPALQTNVVVGNFQFQLCDLLYAVCTFAGVMYVAMAYLNWLERAAGDSVWIFRGFKWVAAGLSAALTLLISFANHDVGSTLDLTDIGALTMVLVATFLAVTGWGLRDTGARVAESPQAKTGAPRAASILPANSATVGESNKSCNGNSI
jgi:Domain of unknown function (DUF4184)